MKRTHSVPTSLWEQVTHSIYSNKSVDRREPFRKFNITDIATTEELNDNSCSCLIHFPASKSMPKDEGVSLGYKFGGNYD